MLVAGRYGARSSQNLARPFPSAWQARFELAVVPAVFATRGVGFAGTRRRAGTGCGIIPRVLSWDAQLRSTSQDVAALQGRARGAFPRERMPHLDLTPNASSSFASDPPAYERIKLGDGHKVQSSRLHPAHGSATVKLGLVRRRLFAPACRAGYSTLVLVDERALVRICELGAFISTLRPWKLSCQALPPQQPERR